MKLENGNAPVQMILQQLLLLTKYQAIHLLEHFDLNPGQAGILFTLSHRGNLTQRELATRIGITPPSMTVALRKMEEKGYVIKQPDELDQRKIRIHLTEKGAGCIDDMKKVFRQIEEIMFRGFLPEEKLLLRRFLLQMEENILKSKEMDGMDMNCIISRMYPQDKEE